MIVGMDVNLDHENHGSDDDETIQCSPVWTGGQMGDRKSVRNIQDDGFSLTLCDTEGKSKPRY